MPIINVSVKQSVKGFAPELFAYGELIAASPIVYATKREAKEAGATAASLIESHAPAGPSMLKQAAAFKLAQWVKK